MMSLSSAWPNPRGAGIEGGKVLREPCPSQMDTVQTSPAGAGRRGGEEGLVPPPSERHDSKIKCSCHRNINWEENLEMTLEQKTEHYGGMRTAMKIEQSKGKAFKGSLTSVHA